MDTSTSTVTRRAAHLLHCNSDNSDAALLEALVQERDRLEAALRMARDYMNYVTGDGTEEEWNRENPWSVINAVLQ